jgi:hypothetical protein
LVTAPIHKVQCVFLIGPPGAMGVIVFGTKGPDRLSLLAPSLFGGEAALADGVFRIEFFNGSSGETFLLLHKKSPAGHYVMVSHVRGLIGAQEK